MFYVASEGLNYRNSDIRYDSISAGLPSSKKTHLNQIRILVVDDDTDTALHFKNGLERYGFYVEGHIDTSEALSVFKRDYCDLLLIDIRVVEMSGFELYKRIREKDKKAKVCFTTSFPNYYESLKGDYPEIDSTCLIPKPIT